MAPAACNSLCTDNNSFFFDNNSLFVFAGKDAGARNDPPDPPNPRNPRLPFEPGRLDAGSSQLAPLTLTTGPAPQNETPIRLTRTAPRRRRPQCAARRPASRDPACARRDADSLRLAAGPRAAGAAGR